MNSAAATLTREDEVQSKIRKVSRFGRFARVVCSVIYGFGLVAVVAMLLSGVMGLNSPGPLSDAAMTPVQKMWALPMSVVLMSVWLAAVYQLYRLFGNLANGAIYTAENVHRVRNVGLLWLLAAALSMLIPLVWAVLVRLGALEPSGPPQLEAWLSWSDSLSGLLSGGLVLLISWVMDIGLYEKDHAAELQRDADLVI